MKKGVLSNFAKFTGKHLYQNLFFNKAAGLFKKRIWHRCLPVNLAKFLRTLFFTEKTSGRLLLSMSYFFSNIVHGFQLIPFSGKALSKTFVWVLIMPPAFQVFSVSTWQHCCKYQVSGISSKQGFATLDQWLLKQRSDRAKASIPVGNKVINLQLPSKK